MVFLSLDGVVIDVDDQDILDAKAVVDAAGIGAEPASCATVAGAKVLVSQGIIQPDDTVCGILTGHVLKDPGIIVDYHQGHLSDGMVALRANPPIRVPADLNAIRRALDS